VVTRQLKVERTRGKVHRPKTDVLPLCYATNKVQQCLGTVVEINVFKVFSETPAVMGVAVVSSGRLLQSFGPADMNDCSPIVTYIARIACV